MEQGEKMDLGSQISFPSAGLIPLMSYVSFPALKRLRLICREWNTVISNSIRIKKCRGVLRQDWIKKARGLNFESTLKWNSVFFLFFPFNKNTIFDKYWGLTGQNVTILYFKHVSISCDRVVNFLMALPHITDVTFKQCKFELTRIRVTRTRHRWMVTAPRNLTCACVHEELVLPEGTTMIPPRITRIVLIEENVFPLCIFDLLKKRSLGVLEEFRFDKARMQSWRRLYYRPLPAHIEQYCFDIIRLNVATIRIFSYYQNRRGYLFLTRLRNANIRLHLDTLNIGQCRKSNHWNAIAIHTSSQGFINYLNFLKNDSLRHLAIRFVHDYDTAGLAEVLLTQRNLRYLSIDTELRDELSLDLSTVLPNLIYLQELCIQDANHQDRHSINLNYLNNLPPKLTRLTFYGFYLESSNTIHNFVKSNAARRLTELNIESGRFVTDEIMQTIITTLNQLEVLRINDSMFLTDAGVTGLPLETCKMIIKCNSRLLLSGNVPLSDNLPGVPVNRLTNLRKLSFARCRRLSDVTVFIGIKFPKLVEIDLSQCLDVTDFGMLHLAKNNPSLERIIVMKNLKITHYGINLVLEANPCIENIHTSKHVRDRNLGNQLPYKINYRYPSAVTYKRFDEHRARPMGAD